MIIGIGNTQRPYFLGCLRHLKIEFTELSSGILIQSDYPDEKLYRIRRIVEKFCSDNFISRRFDRIQ